MNFTFIVEYLEASERCKEIKLPISLIVHRIIVSTFIHILPVFFPCIFYIETIEYFIGILSFRNLPVISRYYE